MRERELKKQEIERAWRPVKPSIIGQKRKSSDTLEGSTDIDEEQKTSVELPKPALSPLLTSLLKSPSQVPTSSILHSAITNQRSTNTSSNPMITSLLNSSTELTVSPGLQQLVSSAIGQEPASDAGQESDASQQNIVSANDILDDANLQILKIDDIANSILIENGPLPEMKNDVDVIISDLIDSAHDIVADPEQHLQLDGNGDLNLNLELEDFEESETEMREEIKGEEKAVNENTQNVDPFEFQEDPELFEPSKLIPKQVDSAKQPTNQDTQIQENETVAEITELVEETIKIEPAEPPTSDNAIEVKVEESLTPIVEDENLQAKVEPTPEVIKEQEPEILLPIDLIKTEPETKVFEELSQEKLPIVEKKEIINEDASNAVVDSSVVLTELSNDLYDDLTMEVKVDKSGKAKRDYSRTKKRDDKEFDVLSAIEKVNKEETDLAEESFSDKDYGEVERKDKLKFKAENDRSNSPWTEEEDITNLRSRRRLSTPATPIDSVPNSPVSSIYFYDDDRDYRNWKKSVMLVYSRLAANKYASLFAKPITDDQAPGYHTLIYRPMDLQTIRRNIESGAIKTTQEFQRDVMLMITNALMYNKTNDTVFNMAKQMQQESLQQIHILLQAQSQIDTPARRETRTSEPGLKRKRPTEEPSRSKKRKED